MFVFLLLFLPPALACVISRLAMFAFFARRRANRPGEFLLALEGSCRDLLFILIPLSLFALLRFLLPDEPLPGAVFLFPAALTAWAVLAVNILDGFIYYNTLQRFFPLFLRELRPANVLVSTSPGQKAFILGLLFYLPVQLAVCLALYDTPAGTGDLWFSLGLTLLCAVAAFWRGLQAAFRTGPAAPVPFRYIESCGIGNHEEVAGQARKRLADIGASGLFNLLRVLAASRREGLGFAPRKHEYFTDEKAFLSECGLLDPEKYAPPEERMDFKRIILICIESLGQKMLHRYNNAISPEVMPFLHSLLENYPRLDNFCTANFPTDQGLYALHASRLGYEYDLQQGAGRIETLVHLLHERGFASCSLSGVTRHYGNKEIFFKRLLGYQSFLAEEDVRRLISGAAPCGWGLADKNLYTLALPILEEYRNRRIFLNITGADTHPGYYHTLPEEYFPPAVRNGNSRLLRSFYEADHNLMLFFRALGKAGLHNEETLIIITADHSPNHGNEYLRLNNLNRLTPDLVPLVFVTPKRKSTPFSRIRPEIACGQLDLLPTLIDALGLRRLDRVLGRSLFYGQDNPVLSKFGGNLRLRRNGREISANLDRFSAGAPAGQDAGQNALCKWYFNGLLP